MKINKLKKLAPSDLNVIIWILNICKKQIPTLFFIVFLNIIYGSSGVVFAKLSKNIIDSATVLKDMHELVKYALALLGLVLFQMSMSITRSFISELSKGKLQIILKHHLMNKIMKNDYSKITSYHTGELQNRIFNDVNIITDGFTKIIPNTVFFFSKLISSLIYLIVIDKIFAIIFLVAGIFVFLLTQLLRNKMKALHKAVQETEGKTRSFIQEILTNLLVVKAFSVEDKMSNHTDELQNVNFKAKMKKTGFSIVANTGLSAMFSVGTVFAIGFGAFRILSNTMTYGTVTAMIQLVNQVQGPFASLSGVMPQLFSTIASAERLMEIDYIDNERNINKCNIDKLEVYDKLTSIEFDNISFKYDRDIIFDNTSFSINKGDFIAITGISGIGKSTLLKLLLDVFPLNDGNIYFNLKDEKIVVDSNTRVLFSYVPQGNLLISGTIMENLRFINNDATDKEIEEAIEISCSKQFIDELPDGVNTVIGEKGLGLSEGQVQRLAIARSILSKSPIFLFDEATSALDEETERQFLSNLKRLSGVTCIIVSHKKAALDICNKKIEIINGKIVEG